MLKYISQAFHIGIGLNSITLVRAHRWNRAPVTVLAEREYLPQLSASPEGFQSQLGQLMADIPGYYRPVSVVVADELTRLWQVFPPQGASRQSDLEAAAEMRFQTLYGEPMMGWRMTADWDSREPFFAAAVPGWLLAALGEEGQRKKVAWTRIAPQFLVAWNHWRQHLAPGAWFANVHDNMLTLGAVVGKQLAAVRSTALPQGVDGAWLDTFLQRQSLLLNLDTPRQVLFCGALATGSSEPSPTGAVQWSRLDRRFLASGSLSAGAALAQTGGGA